MQRTVNSATRTFRALAVACALGVVPLHAQAVPLTVDEVTFEGPVLDAGLLSGTVDMSLSGSALTVVLTNTSAAGAAIPGSGAILSGIGFVLPTGVSITSGSVSMAGSPAVNFTAPGDDDLSGEWGYANDPLTSGPFNNPLITVSDVNTVVSAMIASTHTIFNSDPGKNLDSSGIAGPDFGLVSGVGDPGGLEAVRDSLTVTLNLAGSIPGDLLDSIESGDVVLSFGSPNSSTSVPEPGAVSLLALSLLGLAAVRRRLA